MVIPGLVAWMEKANHLAISRVYRCEIRTLVQVAVVTSQREV